jgi:exopolyphosphatase/guanosine-5'-triphosphate,3'-diphosphate pyrophosphatase
MKKMKFDSPYFAAVDLGSNSFHMIIARINDDRLEVIDRVKDMVQLARGIKRDGHLSMDAQERALGCLARFAERLRDIPRHQIRAVGTKTLRSAEGSKQFIKAAEQALGVPIQIISGYEEARLVYSGLAHSVTNDHSRRLVVDIGGGSTEIIIGQDYEPQKLESLSMGCVTCTEKFFAGGAKVTTGTFRKAYLGACTKLEEIRKPYMKTGWDIAYGTSGTIRAIAELLKEKDGGAIITSASLDWLAKEVCDNKTRLGELPALRKTVFPAGVAILKAVFDQLKLDKMHVGDAALKEGLINDIIGRFSDDDARQSTVTKLMAQYKVDTDQAVRVQNSALALWKQIDGPLIPGVSRTKVLGWAALLHEIGMSISHAVHHNHGYYIIRNSDLAGFGRYEQYILANLVRSHRKGLYQKKFEDLDEQTMTALIPLIVCLRLAVLINRRREDISIKPKLSREGRKYRLRVGKRWLSGHPLTLDGLEQEQQYYDSFDISLVWE